MVIERGPEDPPGPRRESYGFTAASPDSVMLTGRSAGQIIEQDERYAAAARRHFVIVVTEAEYLALSDAIAAWRNAEGNRYSLRGRNCIDFVAALARAAGLETPAERGLDPARFLERVRSENAVRLAGGPVIEAPAYRP